MKTVWIHFPPLADPELAEAISDAIFDRDPEAMLIVSGGSPGMQIDDAQIFYYPSIVPGSGAVTEIMEKWKPSALAWLAPTSDPALFARLDKANIQINMADMGQMIDHHSGWNVLSRVMGSRFRHVKTIFVGDGPTRRAVMRAGARSTQVKQVGILERDAETLTCDVEELDRFAEVFSARPVWLAAKVHFDELDAVLSAHLQALRRAHRLVLLLVPGDVDDGDQFAEMLRQKGLEFCQRSRGETPKASTQVYLADRTGELGLWYRLAPVSFIGQTLAGKFGNGPDPLGAAALGSAVVHGPMIEHHIDSFTRLSRARAAYMVAHTGELAYALENFLAPDRAAQMAQAAWSVSTSGSDVMNQMIDALFGLPPQPSAGEEDMAK
jgi:3-deoxy-D-manno-octulosonic-acid transferase